jgi:hypothetical protein
MKTNILTLARLAALSFLVASASVLAQTVRPVVNELGNPAKGHVEYVNDGYTPLNVVLEAKSFSVSDTGEIAYRPLDPDIHLKLSTTSFRIQPQQTYYVYYEATSSKSPSWFVLYAAFSGFNFRTAEGLSVRLQLPHTVYLLPKQSAEQPEIRINRAELNTDENKVLLEVENTGDNMGRVLETHIAYSKTKQDAPGFPIFPHGKRIMEVPLEAKPGDDAPVEVSFQFAKFKVEQKLKRTAAVSSAAAPAAGQQVSAAMPSPPDPDTGQQ